MFGKFWEGRRCKKFHGNDLRVRFNGSGNLTKKRYDIKPFVMSIAKSSIVEVIAIDIDCGSQGLRRFLHVSPYESLMEMKKPPKSGFFVPDRSQLNDLVREEEE